MTNELSLETLDRVSGGRLTYQQEMALLRREVFFDQIRPWQAKKELLIWETDGLQAALKSHQVTNGPTLPKGFI